MGTSIQPTLFDPKPAPNSGTLNATILGLMYSGEWLMPHEICADILRNYGLMISDATATSRLRDLRKTKFGGHIVEKRKRLGSKAFEYRLVR